MNILRTLLSATFLTTAMAAAQAQTPPAAPKPDDHTVHHPADATAPAAPGQTAQAAQAPGGAPMAGGMMGAAPGTPGAGGMMGGMMGGNMGAMMQEMMPMMRTMMMREGMGRMGGGMMPMMGARHIEGRIAFLKAELAITDAQLPQWTTFAAVLRANAKSMTDMHATMAKGPASSAPDRADQMVAHMAAGLETLKTTSGALRALYGVLSAEQKKSADELLVPGMGRM